MMNSIKMVLNIISKNTNAPVMVCHKLCALYYAPALPRLRALPLPHT